MRKSLVVLAGAIVFAALGPGAAADPPAKVQISGAFDNLLAAGDACPFDIQVHSVISGTWTTFVDKSGGTKKEQYHLVEQDTFTLGAESLTGVPFTFNAPWLCDSNGNLTNVYADGVAEKVRLPDGSLFIAAGRIDFVAHGLPGFILTPDHGGTVNLEGFCSALAP